MWNSADIKPGDYVPAGKHKGAYAPLRYMLGRYGDSSYSIVFYEGRSKRWLVAGTNGYYVGPREAIGLSLWHEMNDEDVAGLTSAEQEIAGSVLAYLSEHETALNHEMYACVMAETR